MFPLHPWLIYSSQVRLVQKTDTGKIYAMKTLKKEEMLKKDQVCPLVTVACLRLMVLA